MRILSFGQIAEITGQTDWTVEHVATTEQLRQILIEQFPALNHLTYLIAVNQTVVKVDTPLQKTDVIALLPPFSGG